MELSEIFLNFYKANQLRQSGNMIELYGVGYERIYVDYYTNIIASFKEENQLELSEDGYIRKSSWEPLYRAGHHGLILTLKSFIPYLSSKNEYDKFQEFLSILSLHGFGVFQAEASTKAHVIAVNVNHCFEDHTFSNFPENFDKPLYPYTAGMILACFNLSHSSMEFHEIDQAYVNKMYNDAPDIVQSQFGLQTGGNSKFIIQHS